MAVLIVAIMFELVIIGLSVWANSRFRQVDRLPMQWSLSKSASLPESVNRTARRAVALSFAPFCALFVLILFVLISTVLKPRPGQEAMVVPSLFVAGCVLVAAHVLHIWLIGKTLQHDGN